ncbi:MAG: histone deacetylase [Verrucomicrobia bacterium]|nr:histone deacetylase [Verrucomicrobiota bacterium]
MIIVTDERCTGYSAPGHPERPARISESVKRLRAQTDVALTWGDPLPAPDDLILQAHARSHLDAVRLAARDFDADTPAHAGIGEHAVRSVGASLQALRAAREGNIAFSLMRPPGHHAKRDRAMGFCYLNNMAISVLEALRTGVQRVAVYDFDVHHGNGSEAILLNKPGVAYYSIHQHPCYPGTGTRNEGNNAFNFPVRPRTPREAYRKVLQQALDALKRSKPELVGVSAGFDAYLYDPIAQETLELEDFHWLGGQICGLGVPAFHLLEGGYSEDLPELILAYLKGLSGKPL